jgi:hypothetical protein
MSPVSLQDRVGGMNILPTRFRFLLCNGVWSPPMGWRAHRRPQTHGRLHLLPRVQNKFQKTLDCPVRLGFKM